MKKLVALFLTLVLTVGLLAGCQKEDVYEEVAFSFAENTAAYKTYGRISTQERGVEIAWPASGVEFTLKCSGDVKLKYNSVMEGYLQICVDGVETQRPSFHTGIKSLTVAEGLEQGEHTIRILLESDVSTTGGVVYFSGLEFFGVKDSVKATAQKDLFVEFVGDSITSGKGVLMQGGKYAAVDTCHSPTRAYAVRTAEALGADWSLISRGSCGLIRANACPYTAGQIYPYLNRFAREPVEYSFPRKADISVIALGTNDDHTIATDEELKNALKDLIAQVRGKHGEETPVVLLYGMMTSRWEEQYFEVCQELTNVFSLQVPQNTEGGNGHPDEEASIITAEKLTAFIQTYVLPVLQK